MPQKPSSLHQNVDASRCLLPRQSSLTHDRFVTGEGTFSFTVRVIAKDHEDDARFSRLPVILYERNRDTNKVADFVSKGSHLGNLRAEERKRSPLVRQNPELRVSRYC